MKSSPFYKGALGQLRAILANVCKDKELKTVIAAREEVFARYQPMLSLDNIPDLSEEEFKGFLNFKNNKHWTGLHRMGNAICADMNRLRKALSILLDESRPIKKRLDTLIPRKGPAFVPKMGKAVITGMLHIVHPDRYGVYNGTSEAGMKALDLWPSFERGSPFGERYLVVNEILLQLAKDLNVDLWTLDSLWWRAKKPGNGEDDTGDDDGTGFDIDTVDPEIDEQLFGLERHLHHFMLDNWSSLSLAKEWDLYEEDGDVVGSEYNTGEIGRIDLLARHKTKPRWLVIELKRNQSSDETVGQVTRYMGWVRKNLVEKNDTVHGLIIAHEADTKIRYALMYTKGVDLMSYRVDFTLHAVPNGQEPSS